MYSNGLPISIYFKLIVYKTAHFPVLHFILFSCHYSAVVSGFGFSQFWWDDEKMLSLSVFMVRIINAFTWTVNLFQSFTSLIASVVEKQWQTRVAALPSVSFVTSVTSSSGNRFHWSSAHFWQICPFDCLFPSQSSHPKDQFQNYTAQKN